MSLRLAIIVLLLVANIGSALLVVKMRHENRIHFVELQQLQETRDELQVQWGQLQLEQSAWATHGRIERIAREQLDMIIVDNREVVVLKNGH
ncbi:MAG: cell division protein FtsL [Gammaproteobacteria bacterium]|nr:cell division protein FtsL [Gammaproteobacteria bacterium]